MNLISPIMTENTHLLFKKTVHASFKMENIFCHIQEKLKKFGKPKL